MSEAFDKLLAERQSSAKQGDKMQRMSPLEPLLEGGHVYILKADWNEAFIAEGLAFPKGKHDDQWDAVQISSHKAITSKGCMTISY